MSSLKLFWPKMGFDDQICTGQFWFKLMPWIYWDWGEEQKPSKNIENGG